MTTIFVELENTKLELLYPLGDDSPIAKFLERNPGGGIHHICYEVADIYAARDKVESDGMRVLGDGEPSIGAHDKPVLFLHPKDFNGTLIELEQAEGEGRSMGLISGTLVYVIIWWLVLFMVLPWGNRPPDVVEDGHAASALGNEPCK